MQNLLKETLDILKSVNKGPGDVVRVQWDKFYCTWEQFMGAANFTYDNGFGGAVVETSLKVVGEDWWLERGEYDGSEWWEFKTIPTIPDLQHVPAQDDLKDRL
jgi:hypothetical protein